MRFVDNKWFGAVWAKKADGSKAIASLHSFRSKEQRDGWVAGMKDAGWDARKCSRKAALAEYGERTAYLEHDAEGRGW